MKSIYAIFGVGGCGRSIFPVARRQLQGLQEKDFELVYVDDKPVASLINGATVLSYSEFLNVKAKAKHAVVAIADGRIRSKIVERISVHGICHWTVFASSVEIMDDVNIGEGAMLSPFVTLTSNISIGRHFHANLYSYVEHDCVIGDFVTFAPGAKCNGNVVIEDHAYIGAGAVIKQGRPGRPLVIGRGAVVGMGAVVTRDVPAGVTVVGNPARPLLIKN